MARLKRTNGRLSTEPKGVLKSQKRVERVSAPITSIWEVLRREEETEKGDEEG